MKKVKVRWIDSQEVFGWTMLEDLPKYNDLEVETIGNVIQRTSKGIVVAASITEHKDQVCGVMMIPDCCILSVEEIK